MKSAVPFMINFAVSTLICDFTWSVLIVPMFFMPLLAAHSSGLLMIWFDPNPKIIIFLAFGTLGGIGCSFALLFEQRHRSFVTDSRFVIKRKSTLYIFYFLMYGYQLNFGLPEILTAPEDQESAKLQGLKTVPCPPEAYFSKKSFMYQTDASLFVPHMHMTLTIQSLLVNFYFFHILWHLRPQNTPSMSAATRKMYLSFLYSISIQGIIPSIIIVVPCFYWNTCATFKFYSQEVNNLTIVTFTLHGTATSIATIYLYAPYRNFTKELILHTWKTRGNLFEFLTLKASHSSNDHPLIISALLNLSQNKNLTTTQRDEKHNKSTGSMRTQRPPSPHFICCSALSMDEYYHTTYRTSCNQSISFLSSPEFLKTSCHLGSFFMFTTSFYAVFLVLWVSPKQMRSSVPYILNLHLWTMFCDFMFAIMLLPYFMLPVLVIKPYGLLQAMHVPSKVQLWLAFASLGGMCASITSLFEYRHRSIVSNSRFVMRNKPTIILYNLVLYGYHINFGVPEVLTLPDDQETVKLKLLSILPCPPPIYFQSDVFVLQEDGRTLFNPHMYFTCFSISLITAYFGFHTLWHLRPQNNPLMSQSTRKFQRNFFISSAVQASIPITVVLIPNVYWNLTITFGFHSQEANNISVLILTLHGISASLGIILLYTPYRKFTKNLFRIHVMKTERVSSISMSNLESSVSRRSIRRF